MASLNDVWPDFLDGLDRQPQRAARELYEFTFRLVQVAPPATYRSLPYDIAVDVLYDIVASLLQDNFSLLRSYRNDGRPFALWLRRCVREKANEWISRLQAESIFPAERREAIPKIHSALDSLDCLGKLVLELSADELRPREIARVLLYPDEQKRDIKTELELSRRAFKEALKKNGINLAPQAGSPDTEAASQEQKDG